MFQEAKAVVEDVPHPSKGMAGRCVGFDLELFASVYSFHVWLHRLDELEMYLCILKFIMLLSLVIAIYMMFPPLFLMIYEISNGIPLFWYSGK
jgi:hypothetical protein